MIGRIISADLNYARCEFSDDVQEGDLVAFRRPKRHGGGNVVCRVERLETTSFGGLRGWIIYLDHIDAPPRNMTDVFKYTKIELKGILELGTDIRGEPVKIGINPLFKHTHLAGNPQQGKTHLMIVLLEELIKHGVPCIVIDPQGEFVNFPEIFKDQVVVVEAITVQDLIAHLQQKRTVIINLLGLPKISKAMQTGDLLTQFVVEKEKDYQQAENLITLTKIPPTLIFIDEAEEFAPHVYGQAGRILSKECLLVIQDIAKRGTKMGMGILITSQRPPKIDVDVRAACNSLIAFRMTDAGSHYYIGRQDMITKQEIRRISALEEGQCLLTGSITLTPKTINVRDVEVKRAKEVDFEMILGITGGQTHFKFESTIREDENGDLVHKETGQVVATIEQRVREQDGLSYEKTDGDGVILRNSHLTEEDQKLLNKLKKPNEKGERLIG